MGNYKSNEYLDGVGLDNVNKSSHGMEESNLVRSVQITEINFKCIQKEYVYTLMTSKFVHNCSKFLCIVSKATIF